MERRAIVTYAARLLTVFALQCLLAGMAFAQAWVPYKGVGNVSFVYQNALVINHYAQSTKLDRGHSQSHDVVIDAGYGLTNRLAIRFSVPFITSNYHGDFAHDLNYDNGRYHSAWQDLRFDLRYNVLSHRSLAVTPFVDVIVPSHDYMYFAHSAPGSRLKEFQIGAYVARMLDPIASRMFVQARVAQGFVEPVNGISHSRSYADLEIGYFVRSDIRVFLSGVGLTTYGGIQFPNPASNPNFAAELKALGLWEKHDQIGDEDSANVAAGASMALTHSLDLFGTIGTNLMERNGHAVKRAVSVGVTWHFSHEADAFGDLRGDSSQKIARCVCSKAR